LIFKHNN